MRSADPMNGADENRTPSDLIYLFVDGEASDLERTILFNALVGDSELQAELADAIRINSAAQQEMFETLPPASVTRALFRRIEDLADHRVAGAALPPPGIAPDRPPVKREESRKRRPLPFVFPLLTGLVGLLLGALLFGRTGLETGENLADSRILSAEEMAGARANTPSGELSDRIAMPERPRNGAEVNEQMENSSVAAASSQKSVSKVASSPLLHTETREESASDPSQPSLDEREDIGTEIGNEAADNVAAETENVDQGADQSVDLPSGPNPLQQLAATSLPVGFDYTPPAISLDEGEIGLEELLAVPAAFRVEPAEPTGEESDDRFSFFVRGGNEIGLYPGRSAVQDAAAENLQNLAIGGYYQVDEMHAIGVQGGRDFHPFFRDQGGRTSTLLNVGSGSPALYEPVVLNHVGGGGVGGNPTVGFNESGGRIDSENLLDPMVDSINPTNTPPSVSPNLPEGKTPVSTLDPTIEWLGLGYRFRAPGIDRRGLFRPEFQTALGISSVGPVARALLGMAWKPGTHVSLVAGVEGTGVLYRLDGEMYSSRRIGVVYGVEVGF